MLLVSGWFSVSKTIIPEAREHFLTPSARRDTHPFGGLGIRVVGDGILGNRDLDALANVSYQIVIEGSSYPDRLSSHRILQGQTG